MTLRAGQLRHSVTITRPVEVKRPDGTRAVTWQDVATVRAQFVPASVREFIAASQTQSQITARAVIRWRNDVDATCQLVHDGKTYNIAGVLADPDSGREYLTLPLTEVTP